MNITAVLPRAVPVPSRAQAVPGPSLSGTARASLPFTNADARPSLRNVWEASVDALLGFGITSNAVNTHRRPQLTSAVAKAEPAAALQELQRKKADLESEITVVQHELAEDEEALRRALGPPRHQDRKAEQGHLQFGPSRMRNEREGRMTGGSRRRRDP